MLIPARTRSIFASGISRMPALLEQWRKKPVSPFSERLLQKSWNLSIWHFVNSFSISSAFEKWVNTPSIFIWESILIFKAVSIPTSPQCTPMRDIPVSTARWKGAQIPAFLAASEKIFCHLISKNSRTYTIFCHFHIIFLKSVT